MGGGRGEGAKFFSCEGCVRSFFQVIWGKCEIFFMRVDGVRNLFRMRRCVRRNFFSSECVW